LHSSSTRKESSDLDYSLYPSCEVSYQRLVEDVLGVAPSAWFIQKRERFPSVKPVNLTQKGELHQVMDNNFFANPEWKDAINYLRNTKTPVDFWQGMTFGFSMRTGNALKDVRLRQVCASWVIHAI